MCCHGCGSITGDPLLSAVADSLSVDPAMADIRAELEFGDVDGTLLRFPTPQPPNECALEHSHLQLVQNTFIHYIYIPCSKFISCRLTFVPPLVCSCTRSHSTQSIIQLFQEL